MNKEEQKESFRWLLLILGFLLTAITLLLYVGGDFMKSCCAMKVFCGFMLLLALVAFLVAAIFCESEDSCSPLTVEAHCKNPILNFETDFALCRNNERDKSYTVWHYDSLDTVLKDVTDGDILYIFDSEISFSKTEMDELAAMQGKINNFTIRFSKNRQD